jgi:hypothetical protein
MKGENKHDVQCPKFEFAAFPPRVALLAAQFQHAGSPTKSGVEAEALGIQSELHAAVSGLRRNPKDSEMAGPAGLERASFSKSSCGKTHADHRQSTRFFTKGQPRLLS